MARKPLSRLLLAVVVSLLVTGGLAEIGGRLYLSRWADEEVLKRYGSLRQLQEQLPPRLSPHRYLGYYPTPGYEHADNRHNALGYRGDEIVQPKPAGEFRIVCLGGSTTYTTQVGPAHLAYPALLQTFLRREGHASVTVVNAGGPGWSTWESLINLQIRVLDLDPDMIIVYHAINDIDPRLVWPPEAYKSDNSGKRGVVSNLFMPNVLEYSTVLRYLLIKAGLAIPHSEYTATVDKGPPTFYGEEFRVQFGQGRYPDGIFREVSAQQMLEVNQPIFFERNLENIVATARHWGVEVVLATFAYSPGFTQRPWTGSAEFRGELARYNGIIAQLATDQGVHLFDFAAVFPTDMDLYTDGCHVNQRGVRLKANLFTEYLIENDLVP